MFPLQSRPKRVILEKRVISDDASLAQLVEQLTCNQQVVGSSPTAGSIFFAKISPLVPGKYRTYKTCKSYLLRKADGGKSINTIQLNLFPGAFL